MTKKILIAGSREYNNYDEAEVFIDLCLKELNGNEDIIIISGGCRGADAIGEKYAREKGIEVVVYPAEWSKYGKAAGPIRNCQMADECDVAICFWDGKSRGTKSLIDYMNKIRKRIYIIPTQKDRQLC